MNCIERGYNNVIDCEGNRYSCKVEQIEEKRSGGNGYVDLGGATDKRKR